MYAKNLSNVKRTNQSFDSQGGVTNTSGIITPSGTNIQQRIKLPSLQEKSSDKVRVDMPRDSMVDSQPNALELQSVDKHSQGSYL